MEKNILEFVTFTIGSVAERVHKSPSEIYGLFKRLNVIDGYLVPAFDVLHTFGRQYLVNDVLDFLQEKELSYADISCFIHESGAS